MTKPKEWWMYPPETKYPSLVEVLTFDPAPKHECIVPYTHVIEYSAYDALMAETMKLKEAIDKGSWNLVWNAINEFDKFLEGLK